MTRLVCINLDRVPARWAFMSDEAARAGVADDLERLSATDGAAPGEIAGYEPHRWSPRWELTRSETAVFDSHRRAWARGLETGAPFVVFEDDVHLSLRFRAGLSAAGSALRPGGVIKLDGVYQTGRYGPPEPLPDGFALRPLRQITHSAGCYLVSPEAARDMLNAARRFCDHLDDFVLNPAAPWAPRQLEPAIALQSVLAADRETPEVVSESERLSGSATRHGKARGPLAYRAAKEMRRTGRRLWRRTLGDRLLSATGGHIGAVPLAEDLGPYRAI